MVILYDKKVQEPLEEVLILLPSVASSDYGIGTLVKRHTDS